MSTDGVLTADTHLVLSFVAVPIVGACGIVLPPEGNHHALADLEKVGEIRGGHFMMGIVFVRCKSEKAAQIRGLIVRPLGNITILSPMLVMGDAMIDRTTAIRRESIAEVHAAL